MNRSNKIVLASVIAIPAVTACAIAFYLYKKQKDEENENIIPSSCTKENILEINIPVDRVASLIGRNGHNIKQIQEKSNTKILFKEDDDKSKPYKICRILGNPESIKEAEALINYEITNKPAYVTETIEVPKKCCGRLIGRCGESIRAIQNKSNAHVMVEKFYIEKSELRPVIIKGTVEQVAVAKSLIEEIVKDEEQIREMMQERMARSPRMKSKFSKHNTIDTEVPDLEVLPLNTFENVISVYCSSVANPHKFWIQQISDKAAKLDHLLNQMTQFYENEDNKKAYSLTNKQLILKQVVVAPFPSDSKYYRAQVREILSNRSNPRNPKIDIYYLDYGDSLILKQSELYAIKPDFLSLPCQAICCRLHGCQPIGTKWTDENIDLFEDLALMATWRPLTLQIVHYIQSKEGVTIPCIKLFDPTKGGTDIVEELIKKQAAKLDENEPEFLGEIQSNATSRNIDTTTTVDDEIVDIDKRDNSISSNVPENDSASVTEQKYNSDTESAINTPDSPDENKSVVHN